MITKTFVRERETKSTYRYKETGAEAEHAVGQLYLKKVAAAQLGNPETLAVVIGTPAEFETSA
jgi:hypothetical protein